MRLLALLVAAGVTLGSGGLAQAALLLDFVGPGAGTANSTASFTVSDVDTGANTTTQPTGSPNVNSSGTFAGTTGTFTVLVEPASSFTSSGNNITGITLGTLASNNTTGWGVLPGGEIEAGELLLLTFDFSGLTLPPGMGIELVSFSVGAQAAAQSAIYWVDGVSNATINSVGTLYTVNTALPNGSRIGFGLPTGGDNYRIDEITLNVVNAVPEPASFALLGLGGIGLLLSRRRRA